MPYTSTLNFGPYGDYGNITIPASKESVMPWAVAAPAIASLAGTVGSAIMDSRSQNKATKASQDANMAALQYQRERDKMSREDWLKAMAAYEANRNALLQRYGISVPSQQQPAPTPDVAVPRQMGGQLRGIPGDLGALIRGGGYTGPRQMA